MRAIRKHLMRERRAAEHGVRRDGLLARRCRSASRGPSTPGPIWRAGKAAGKTDEQIWADYDEASELT